MFFRLCNSPGTFQTFMDHIFQELKMKGYVIVYMDEILIFSTTLEEHKNVVKEVLEILQKNKLCVKPDKCEFHQNEVEFLGFIVRNRKIKMDPGKVAAVREWKSPTTKKEVQTFLGFANFYWKFIKNFAEDSLNLTPLTGKKEWLWSEDQERSFQSLINKMCQEPVLWTIKDEGRLKMEVDGSGFAMGAVLMQEQGGKRKPLTHMSKTYSSTERNYHTR